MKLGKKILQQKSKRLVVKNLKFNRGNSKESKICREKGKRRIVENQSVKMLFNTYRGQGFFGTSLHAKGEKNLTTEFSINEQNYCF